MEASVTEGRTFLPFLRTGVMPCPARPRGDTPGLIGRQKQEQGENLGHSLILRFPKVRARYIS